MAHIGSAYPVVDRRDFNLNVKTNGQGFAHRYLCTLTRLPPGIGNGLQGTTWDCGPDGVDPIERLFWGSDPRFVGPFVYDTILTATIVNGFEYIKRFEIREAISGTILRLQLDRDPSPSFPNFSLLQTWNVIFRDPFFFSSDGFQNQINAIQKTWADGPPH